MVDNALERLWSKVYDHCANENFYGSDEKVGKSIFLDFEILLPWRHFGSRSRALGVWCGYGW